MAEDPNALQGLVGVVVTEQFRTDADPLRGSFFSKGLVLVATDEGRLTIEEFAAFTCNNIEEHWIQSMCDQQSDEHEEGLQSEDDYEALLRVQDTDAYLDALEMGDTLGLPDPCTVDQFLEANPPYTQEDQEDGQQEEQGT